MARKRVTTKAASRKSPDECCEGRFQVVCKTMAVRAGPSTTAKILSAVKLGQILVGEVHVLEGQLWLRLSEASIKDIVGILWVNKVPEAWALIHGEHLGLGDLLRPAQEEVEVLEDLLLRLGGEEGPRVRAVADALSGVGLRTGAELLAATETRAAREELEQQIADEALCRDCVVPVQLVSCLRRVVEDSRLSFSGFPQPPPYTKNRILFTAPHSLPLTRPGHKPHVPETYTSNLAREFALVVGGAFLTWTRKEEGRAKEYFKHLGRPDPTNKDPNYTPRDALRESPWTRNLREVRDLFGEGQHCFHVDLHGCRDPGPSEGSHLVVGLRAMEFAGRESAEVEHLRLLLQMTFAVALRGLSVNVRPQKQLTGALDKNQCTLTQQSLSEEGGNWRCAVQLEMSMTLRKILGRQKEARILMAQAIMYAWYLILGSAQDPVTQSNHLQYWLSRCKIFYTGRPTLISERKHGHGVGNVGALAPKNEVLSDVKRADPSDTIIDVDSTTMAEGCEFEELDEDDERAGELGEDTANSETRAAPYDGPIESCGAELIAQAKALQCRTEQVGPIKESMRPTEIISLRDWFKGLIDFVPLPVPDRQYFVAGAWAKFRPEELDWDGSKFVRIVTVGQNGPATFQIMLGPDCKDALYPSVNNAGPHASRLLGPDGGSQGRKWSLGSGSNRRANLASPGHRFRIILAMDRSGLPQSVTWEHVDDEGALQCDEEGAEERMRQRKEEAQIRLEARRRALEERKRELERKQDVEVVVHIDRDLGLQTTVKLHGGATVRELKERIADMDPTGRVNPLDFGLRVCGQGDVAPLEDMVQMTPQLAELDFCPLGG